MYNDSQKIEIAKNFENLYQAPVSMWTPDKEYQSDEERYLVVYENLIIGVYGDCYGVNAKYDEDGELINEATEYEVQVDRIESSNDSCEMFCFEITSQLTAGNKLIEDHGKYGSW